MELRLAYVAALAAAGVMVSPAFAAKPMPPSGSCVKDVTPPSAKQRNPVLLSFRNDCRDAMIVQVCTRWQNQPQPTYAAGRIKPGKTGLVFIGKAGAFLYNWHSCLYDRSGCERASCPK